MLPCSELTMFKRVSVVLATGIPLRAKTYLESSISPNVYAAPLSGCTAGIRIVDATTYTPLAPSTSSSSLIRTRLGNFCLVKRRMITKQITPTTKIPISIATNTIITIPSGESESSLLSAPRPLTKSAKTVSTHSGDSTIRCRYL
jgi:hypothetical protein